MEKKQSLKVINNAPAVANGKPIGKEVNNMRIMGINVSNPFRKGK